MVGDNSRLTVGSSDLLSSAVTLLVDRAVKSGDLTPDGIDPIDLLRALTGVAMAGAGPDWHHAAARMVDVLLRGVFRRR